MQPMKCISVAPKHQIAGPPDPSHSEHPLVGTPIQYNPTSLVRREAYHRVYSETIPGLADYDPAALFESYSGTTGHEINYLVLRKGKKGLA